MHQLEVGLGEGARLHKEFLEAKFATGVVLHQLRASKMRTFVYRVFAVWAAPVVAEASQMAVARVRPRERRLLLVS